MLPHVRGARVEVTGGIGASPEIYVQRRSGTGWALVTAFSGEPLSLDYRVGVDPSAVLGVLGHPFRLTPEGVELPLEFKAPESCASAFVLGDKGSGAQVYASTGKLEAIVPEGLGLRVTAATDAEVTVALPDSRLVTASIPAGEAYLFN